MNDGTETDIVTEDEVTAIDTKIMVEALHTEALITDVEEAANLKRVTMAPLVTKEEDEVFPPSREVGKEANLIHIKEELQTMFASLSVSPRTKMVCSRM